MPRRHLLFFHDAVAVAAAGLVLCAAGTSAIRAQLVPAQATTPSATATPANTGGAAAPADSSKPLAGVAEAVPATRHSMLEEPAVPARIDLNGDLLSISATNASLEDVLRQVAARTGMQIEGNSRDERVYGTYGPGTPEEVLTALLYDSGYNVLMVGSTGDGAPRRLLLTPRTKEIAAASTTGQTSKPAEEDEDEAPVEAPPPFPPPGRIGQPPANAAPQPTTPAQPGQVRTPQQMLQDLQRLNQAQQQQQNNSPQ